MSMKDLLRSTFIVGPTENKEAALENARLLASSGVGFEEQTDNVVWTYVWDFVRDHAHVPQLSTLQAHFQSVQEDAILDRLEQVITSRPLPKGDFERELGLRHQERQSQLTSQMLATAAEILTRGVKEKQGKETVQLRGPTDAINYLLDKAHDIVTPVSGNQLSGIVGHGDDGENLWAEYEHAKLNPDHMRGQATGIDVIDLATKGAQRYQLWVHAAFTGNLKSTFMFNWLYHQAIICKENALAFSLEMPYLQCRRSIYALHSAHPKWGGRAPLVYEKIRDGELSPSDEEFLQRVIEDMTNPANGYGKIMIEVADPAKTDFTVADIRHKAETLFAKHPFKLMFVDHALLVSPRKFVPSTTDRLNEVIRDCKKMAMAFNHGAGMAVCLLFQISREGYKAAVKARENGRMDLYNLTALSYANECERSADIVTSTYLDETLGKESQFIFQCLKSRDQKPFDPFLCGIIWACRRFVNVLGASTSSAVDLEAAALEIERGIG